jgi:flagellar hook protein FlgE
MFSIFNTALSGLSAIATAVDVVGNNLANLNTTGYKATTVAFHDMMDLQLGESQTTNVGIGVGVPTTVRHFTQGSLQQTTGAFDAAISGQGFFVVRDSNDQQLYTRAGNFTMDGSGHLMTATGQYVQGWTASGGTVNVGGAVGDIVLPMNGVNAGKPTSVLALSANLDASGVAGEASGKYSAPVQIVDSLGATHTVTVTFTKTGANAWDYSVDIPAAELATGGTTQLAKGSLTFDANGKLDKATKPVDIKLAKLANGAADQTIGWNLVSNDAGLVTQFAQKSALSASTQDGVLAGQITGVGLADGGLVIAHYSTGQQQIVGQLALASITNPESLISIGNNNFRASTTTSTAPLGAAGTAGRGSIMAGELEASTVDIASEFTNLITFQRSYSANSRVITTADEMLQDVLNVKR